jgi:hypothetical protein
MVLGSTKHLLKQFGVLDIKWNKGENMKRLLVAIFLMILIFHGLSLLLFVIKMTQYPAGMMGMMMGRQMMYRHMFYWFSQTFWLSILLSGVVVLVWSIYSSVKNKK